MFERQLHEETTGRRHRTPATLYPDSGQWHRAETPLCLNVGVKPEQPETSLFVVSTKLATITLFCFYFQLRNYQCGAGALYVWYIVIKIKQQLRPGAHMCWPLSPPSSTHRTTVPVASLFLVTLPLV